MKIDLVNGDFTGTEALDLLSQLTAVKIKYHEQKIQQNLTEEDIKMRELRIKKLQENLHLTSLKLLENPGAKFELSANLNINKL